MIQEIFDYLSTRAIIINHTGEELVDIAKDPKMFRHFIKNISKVMQEEDFFLTSLELVQRVETLLQTYRFDFLKEKEINDEMNYIIGRLCDYRNFHSNQFCSRINNWLLEERKNRGLPSSFQKEECLLLMISMDYEYLWKIFSLEEQFEIENPVEYLSLLHLLLERFPETFQDETILGYAVCGCEICSKVFSKFSFPAKLAKKIQKRLLNDYNFSEAQKPAYSYSLVKKKEN